MRYKDSGVDVDRLKDVKSRILSLIKDKSKGAGLFASGVEVDDGLLLFSSIDGVGTKTKIASMMGRYDTIGYDIVNHCVNDIISVGVKPVSFLDYVGFSEMDPENLESIIRSVFLACEDNGITLVGGETAQMPGMYPRNEFELVGVINGLAREEELITGERIEEGDILWGFRSSGLHTNGYSLARKVLFDMGGFSLDYMLEGESLGEILLRPHRSYLKEFIKARDVVKGVAHITGGGFYENVERVLPERLGVRIYRNSWDVPAIFRFIKDVGDVEDEEMFRTFNMGIGMIFITDGTKNLENIGGIRIGEVVRGEGVEIV